MSERFHIGPGWGAVIVTLFLATVSGVWYFATSQSRTETTVAALDKRTEKMEAKLDSIAIKLQVAQTASISEPVKFMQNADAAPCREVQEPPRFVVSRPFP